MKAAELKKQIDARQTGPLYLIEGDDAQLRHELGAAFAALVDEELHAFNVERFYANEATTSALRDEMISTMLAAARTLPMVAPRRVVVVNAAERLLSPKKSREEEGDSAPAVPRGRKARATTPPEELEAYFSSPEPQTTLVFVAEGLDSNRRLVRLLRQHATSVDAGSLDSAADAGRWVRQRLERDKLTIEISALSLLLEGTGLALGRLRAEVEKLVLYAAGESTITARHVRDLVSPSSEPAADFALGRAIWNGDTAGALREVDAQFDAGAQAVMLLGQIRAATGRLRPDARVRSGMDAVFRTDLAIKSSTGDPRFLVERLVVELCAGGPSPWNERQRR